MNEGKCSNLTTSAGSVAEMRAAGWNTSAHSLRAPQEEQVEEKTQELQVSAAGQAKAEGATY